MATIVMQAFYLFCSFLSTSLTTLTLSLFLPLRYLLSLVTAPRAASHGGGYVSLYQGTIRHERRRPVHHSFCYSVRYALIDLDRVPNPLPNHLSADEARRHSQTNGPVFLLTIPPSVGYEQNPVSFYYCHDVEGSNSKLKKCIAEVNNTPWNERLSFVFDPNNDDVVAKPLHVSTFMDMLGNWRMKTNAPGDNVAIKISVQHPKLGDYLTATLTAKKVSSHMAVDHALFFWLIPHKVVLGIYWQALKLWWKGVPFHEHPKYANPEYREEAIQRDRKFNGCPLFGSGEQNCLQDEGSSSDLAAGANAKDHYFRWRDAKWPWY